MVGSGGHPGHSGGKPDPNALRLVFWETTAGCNLECVHCRRLDVAREMMRDDLTTAEALALVESIARVGRPILVLSGGEPLLRPDILTIARHAADQGLIVSLATNGTLITPEMAARVKDAGIKRASISVDGADAATHDVFRALPGSFESALRGLALLRDAGVEVQINTTVAQHNDGQLEGIYELARSMGAVAFHAFMLVPVGCGVQIADDQMLTPERYEEVLNEFYDLSQRGEMQLKATCAPHYYRILRQRAREEGSGFRVQGSGFGRGAGAGSVSAPGHPGAGGSPARDAMAAMTRGCLAGTNVCFVSHKGEVFPCGYLPLEAGNVRTRDFGDIWRDSELFHSLREGMLGGKCGACEFRKVCMGCRARAYYATGDYLAEEPYCSYQPRARGEG